MEVIVGNLCESFTEWQETGIIKTQKNNFLLKMICYWDQKKKKEKKFSLTLWSLRKEYKAEMKSWQDDMEKGRSKIRKDCRANNNNIFTRDTDDWSWCCERVCPWHEKEPMRCCFREKRKLNGNNEEDNDRHGGQDSNKRVRLLLGKKYNRGNDQRYNW